MQARCIMLVDGYEHSPEPDSPSPDVSSTKQMEPTDHLRHLRPRAARRETYKVQGTSEREQVVAEFDRFVEQCDGRSHHGFTHDPPSVSCRVVETAAARIEEESVAIVDVSYFPAPVRREGHHPRS